MTLSGKYILERADNFEQWLAAVGVERDHGVAITVWKPVIDISQNGDEVEMVSKVGNGYSQHTIAFTLGKECPWTVYGGTASPYMVKFVKEGKNLYKGIYDYNGFRGETAFEVFPDKLIQTYIQGSVKAKKEYKRL